MTLYNKSLLVGVDLGKTSLSMAMAEPDSKGGIINVRTESVRHQGRPLDTLIEILRQKGPENIIKIAATGIYSDRLALPVITGLPDEIAQELATRNLFPDDGLLNIVRLGGSGYSVLTRDTEGRYHFEENDKCSAGTGETIEKICKRLGLDLDRAIELAEKAEDVIPITARCSVFAKSEMTHYANQGESHPSLLAGYFRSVAGNVASLYEKLKVDGPVILIGNGALIRPVSNAFAGMCQNEVGVSEYAGAFEAMGALYYAGERFGEEGPSGLPQDLSGLVRAREKRIKPLTPARRMPGSAVFLKVPHERVSASGPTVLGLDLGSTGSKAALWDQRRNTVMADVYRPTEGNPVEAAKALVTDIMAKADNPVIAVGLTGSGRDAAATVFRAACPGLEDRIVVQNEIVAHAEAAMTYDPDRGKSLSIVEIGGQDAKFINVEGGRVIESDMNRACSAGTGSFLEEQGIFYGIDDITRFGEMAARAEGPPDLGQMCTVFVAEQAAEALNEGYSVDDVFAGFMYSVIVNYKNRVMGNRRFLDKVFFQGKPATNWYLARTLAAIIRKEVYVPPNPGAMGAIGIAMLAAANIKQEKADRFDLKAVTSARVKERRTFQCKDPACDNLCPIESSRIEVMGREEKVLSGGRCPKYESMSAGGEKLGKDSPNPYLERRRLVERIERAAEGNDAGPAVAIPYGHYLIDYLPFFLAFFSRLGTKVKVVHSGRDTFPKGNRRCSAGNTCTPVKLMHGLVPDEADYVFMPKMIEIPRQVAGAGAATCPLTQAAPEMVEKALEAEGHKAKVLRTVLHLAEHGFRTPSVWAALHALQKRLCEENSHVAAGFRELAAAYRHALRAQDAYERELLDIGRRALLYADRKGHPVVVVSGSSHVIHEPVMNAGIHELIMQNGAMAVPLDCFPVPGSVPPLSRVYWGASSRTLRASVAAARRGNTFPLMIVSYGCGPGSFVERLFNHILEDYPHTVLESDGHGGKAGYVTRVQAFLYSARNYEGEGAEAVAPKLEIYDRDPALSDEEIRNSKVVDFAVGVNTGRLSSAVKRSGGYDCDYAGPSDEDALRLGRESCTGKECLPYQLIFGNFRKYLREHPPNGGKRILLNDVTGCGPCRNGMFNLADEISLEKMGLKDKVGVVTPGSFEGGPALAAARWVSIVAVDLLNQLRLYYRPVEAESGSVDRIFERRIEELESKLEEPVDRESYRQTFKSLSMAEDLLERAALEFEELLIDPEKDASAGSVYLCGDVFLRVDDWGSDNLARKINDLGLRVALEPYGELGEFLAFYRSSELVELETRWLHNRLMRYGMDYATSRLVQAVKKRHPWIKWDDPIKVERESRELLERWPLIESIPAMGSALLAWREKRADGIVVVGPWGCGPALIMEAQLKRKTELPLLFVYNDGDPIDEKRLAGFAWRIKHNLSAKITKGPHIKPGPLRK